MKQAKETERAMQKKKLHIYLQKLISVRKRFFVNGIQQLLTRGTMFVLTFRRITLIAKQTKVGLCKSDCQNTTTVHVYLTFKHNAKEHLSTTVNNNIFREQIWWKLRKQLETVGANC